MSEFTVIREKVIGIVNDDSGKLANPADFDRNINAALSTFSRHRPDTKVVDITGNEGSDYNLPDGWVADFSSIRKIEYPIGDIPETCLDPDDYGIYQTPQAKKIRLNNASPSTLESFRVTFTILRTFATVSSADENAFCNLAASLCMEDLSNVFAQTSDPTIGADVVNYRTKSQEFASRAKRLTQLYKEHMGIKEDDITRPASAVKDISFGYPGGSDRLTHPRRARENR